MNALIDVLIYLFIIGGMIAIAGFIVYGIFKVYHKIQMLDAESLKIANRTEYREGWERAKNVRNL